MRFSRLLVTAIVFGLALTAALVLDGAPSTYAWTAPAALNTNAATDSGRDESPSSDHRRRGQLGGGLGVP